MTQAVNLANFANNLDSSGGLNPSALNAAVPLSKGGTGQTTLAATVALIGDVLFPVGSIYTNATNSTNPASLLGFGTWVVFGATRVLIGQDGSGYVAGATGGSANAVVVSHAHTASSATTATDSGHTHYDKIGQGAGGSLTSWSHGNAGTSLDTQTYPTTTGNANITASTTTTVDSSGVSGTNANLPPYIVVYMWRRTV